MKQTHCRFYLLPNYSLLALTSAVEALRVANKKANSDLYSWELVSNHGGLFASSGGVELFTIAISKIDKDQKLDRFIICGGDGSEHLSDEITLNFVRHQTRQSFMAGAISDGSYLAAKAGVFDGYRSTIHWECHDGYVEQNPDLEVTRQIYEIDRERFSCAGGSAAFDLFLKLVEMDHGRHLSLEIAENSVVADIRSEGSRQRMNPSYKFAAANPHIGNVIDKMERHLENPLSIQVLADEEGISVRQLGRIFHQYVGDSPIQFYMELRIRRAAKLLRQTTMSIDEVSIACGFASSSHLAKNFKKIWKVSPREYRIE
ncbi:GlxA family transcriptional regulator [Curvivirga aplysinae]|uniref:GlxA family transcriptional regulator n=1 Tax=Curvivirga aplysinae TaxID=2529852 RepID=UPI0012BBCFBB|nr:GlxA family transcriptional regulator [Curvivirga aplysinae]MTI11014.1 GlxA family transcriptional regulator [Curvivirga aplysinae]